MEKEIWKTIEENPNYMVSNFGRVRSLITNKILKQQIDKYGYLTVGLCKNGSLKRYKVHRLVAEAFIPNPNNLPEVNHKSEIKTQNNVENLEWCDRKYNMNYGTRNKRMGETQKGNTRGSKPVIQIDKNTNEVIAEFPSTMEVKRQLGFSCTNISSCCLGKIKSAYGFKWQYKEAS